MSTQSDRHAVVVGLDSLQGLQTARLLHGHGITVTAVANDLHHPYCRTRVPARILEADTGSDDLIAVLASIDADGDAKPVLVPCQDQSVALVSRRRDDLSDRFRFNLPPDEVVGRLMSKPTFVRHAQEIGLTIPPTVLVTDDDDLEQATEEIGFPCVFKPAVRTARWNSKTRRKVHVVDGADELRTVFADHRGDAETFVVQSLIPGDDSTLHSFNGYFDRSGTPLATFTARKMRQWPPGAGSSSSGIEVEDADLLATALTLFGSVSYSGLAYLETKRDPRTGTHYVIEANVGRPTGRSAIAEAGGVELLLTMFNDIVGDPLPAARTQTHSGAKWVDLRHDLQAVAVLLGRRETTVGEVLRSFRGPKTFAVASRRDPLPFLADLASVITDPRRKARSRRTS
jgi:predicted ATP-grasp superfamily ATP-dependent carboligase